MWVVLKKTTTKQCQNLQLQLVECTLPMLLAKKKKPIIHVPTLFSFSLTYRFVLSHADHHLTRYLKLFITYMLPHDN